MGCKEKRETLSCRTSADDFILKECLCDQVIVLGKLGAGIDKSLLFDEKEGGTAISKMDSLQWEKQLGLFFKSDIKKTRVSKQYDKEVVCIGSDGVVCHEVYKLKPGEKAGVSYLRISTTHERVDSIQVMSGTANYLYEGEKLLALYFDPVAPDITPGERVLARMTIQSAQKVATRSEKKFSMEAVVVLP